MHRDVKLGLALGILVIGFAAAFCFPRQPATELPINPAAGLKLAAVDEEIRMQRRRSFVGDELTPPAQPTLAEPVAHAVVNAELPPLQTAASRLQSELPAVPEPIRPEAGNAGASPSELVMASTGPPFAGAGESMPVEPPAAAEEIYYTVQPGDTLSAVATKMLGSSRKYESIYEANRDVLATPNSLSVGMKLRIPQEAAAIARRTPGSAAPAAKNASPAAARMASKDSIDTDAAPLRREGLFSPVRPRASQAQNGDSIRR